MKLRTHTCRATACQHVISTGLLMCIDHWRLVPAPLRRQIVALAKQGGARPIRAWPNSPHDDVVEKYREAVASAVATVQEKQERKVQAAAGSGGGLFNT